MPVYQPECVVVDLTDTASVESKVAGILEQCGQVDILINNSSISTRSDVLSSNIDTDIRVMNVNYFGPIALTKGNIYTNLFKWIIFPFFFACDFYLQLKKAKITVI